MEMSFDQGRLTGQRNIFNVYSVGVVKGNKLMLLRVKRRYQKALEGLEEFEKLLVIYLDGRELKVHIAKLRKLEGNNLYFDYSEEINGRTVIDIKPYFKFDG